MRKVTRSAKAMLLSTIIVSYLIYMYSVCHYYGGTSEVHIIIIWYALVRGRYGLGASNAMFMKVMLVKAACFCFKIQNVRRDPWHDHSRQSRKLRQTYCHVS